MRPEKQTVKQNKKHLAIISIHALRCDPSINKLVHIVSHLCNDR